MRADTTADERLAEPIGKLVVLAERFIDDGDREARNPTLSIPRDASGWIWPGLCRCGESGSEVGSQVGGEQRAGSGAGAGLGQVGGVLGPFR